MIPSLPYYLDFYQSAQILPYLIFKSKIKGKLLLAFANFDWPNAMGTCILVPFF